MEQESEQIPQFLMQRRHLDDPILFSKRVEHEELIANILRNALGVVVERTETGFQYRLGDDPIINEKGAKQLHSFLQTNINTVTSLTQWNEDQANTNTRQTAEELGKLLWSNNHDMGIKNEMLAPIAYSIVNVLQAQMLRAVNGRENTLLSTIQGRQENIIHEDEKKTGGFGRLFGRRTEQKVVQ